MSLDIKKLRELGVVEREDGEDQLANEEIQVVKYYDREQNRFIIELPDEFS